MITVVADWARAPTDGRSCVDHVRGCVVMTFRSAVLGTQSHTVGTPLRVDAGHTLGHISRCIERQRGTESDRPLRIFTSCVSFRGKNIISVFGSIVREQALPCCQEAYWERDAFLHVVQRNLLGLSWSQQCNRTDPRLQVPIPTCTGPRDGACCAVVVLVVLVDVSVLFQSKCQGACATTRFEMTVRWADI